MLALYLLVLVGCVQGLYEDQVFKFDWRKQYIGKVEHLQFYGSDRDPVIIVGTKRNVVAALDSDNGRILWRHKFEEEPGLGSVGALAVLGKHVVSVSGSTDLFLRLWDPLKGALVQEHWLKTKDIPDLLHLSKSKLWTVYYKHNSVEITSFYFDSKKTGEATTKIISDDDPASRIIKCVVGGNEMLVCATSTGALYSSIKSGEKFQFIPFPQSFRATDVFSMMSTESHVQLESNSGIITYKVTGTELQDVTEEQSNSWLSECPGLKVEQPCEEKGKDAEGNDYCLQYSNDLKVNFNGKDQVIKISEMRGKLERVWSECRDDPDAFQLILTYEDGSLVSLTPRGNIMFAREEGLASIQKVELVAMGFQNQNFQIKLMNHDNPFDPASLVKNFVNRLRRHLSYLQTFILSLTDLNLTEKSKTITPDRFGLKKIIVAVTEHNKMYGIDSMSGEIIWQIMFPGSYDVNIPRYQPQTYLLIQKDGRAGDYAQAILTYKHWRSVHFMMAFNPLTGAILSNDPIHMVLDQALLLPELPDHDLKPVLLVGKDGTAEIYPSNAISCLKQGPPMFIATRTDPGKLVGRKVLITESQQIKLAPVWSLISPNTEIVSVKSRHPEERIHSAGRVLADRSVLFKYMNPNLALVMAKGTDSTAKIFINVYLIDMVTGKVFYSASHKKVLPPFHVVHSENWGVYSFFNDKARRTELISLELYEGKYQSNSSVFSSVENTVTPLVERQAYILPASDITAIKETMTEHGITTKHLLIGTSVGTIIDLPIHLVDPRRPPLDSPMHVREPGIPPYIPELSVPHESILNYNQTLLGVRNIVTSPTGLESTSLVFIYGLDIYGTRVTPSKGFDLIKEDFDYLMITGVIAGLVVACYVTRKFSQKKMLTQAWK